MLNKQEQEEYNMEKIIVNPEEVRGYGNIISPKKLDDYAGYHNELNMSTETVDGEEISVINTKLKREELYFQTCPARSAVVFGTYFVAQLKDKNGKPLGNKNIDLYVDNVKTLSKNTNSAGKAEFVVQFQDIGRKSLHLLGNGVNSSKYFIDVVDANNIVFTGDKTRVWGSETVHFHTQITTNPNGHISNVPVYCLVRDKKGAVLQSGTKWTNNNGMIDWEYTTPSESAIDGYYRCSVKCGNKYKELIILEKLELWVDATMDQNHCSLTIPAPNPQIPPVQNGNILVSSPNYPSNLYWSLLNGSFMNKKISFKVINPGTGFCARITDENTDFDIIYDNTTHKIRVHGTTYDCNVQANDVFEIITYADKVRVIQKRNNTSLFNEIKNIILDAPTIFGFVNPISNFNGCYVNNIIAECYSVANEPSSVNITSNKNVVIKNNQIILTTTVTKNNAPATGEAVSFYANNTKIGNGTTNNNGLATCNYTPPTEGVLNISAEVNNVRSNIVNVRVKKDNIPFNIIISTPSSVFELDEHISPVAHVIDSEGDSCSGASVQFHMSLNNLDYVPLGWEVTTDNDGFCESPQFFSANTGMILYFKATCNNKTSNVIKVYIKQLNKVFYSACNNENNPISDMIYQSGALLSIADGGLKITTNNSSEVKVNCPILLEAGEDVQYEMDYVGGSGTNVLSISLNKANNVALTWMGYYPSLTTKWRINGNEPVNAPVLKNGDHIKLIYMDGKASFYCNNVLIGEYTLPTQADFYCGFFTVSSRVQIVKNIKISKLL